MAAAARRAEPVVQKMKSRSPLAVFLLPVALQSRGLPAASSIFFFLYACPTMNTVLISPDRYRAILGEYDAILAHACAISGRLVGRAVVEQHLSYAETIFTKLLCHAISLRSLSPTLHPSAPLERWDIGSACVVARTLIEAFDALAYISLDSVSPSEREFRILLWELHGKQHRLKMLENNGTAGPAVEAIRADVKTLYSMVTAHAFYTTISKEMKGKIGIDKAPAYLRSQKDRNSANEIDHDYYNGVEMLLSQYVHTTPFALSQLELAHAGDPGALQLLALPLQHSKPFLAKAIVGIGLLWPDAQVEMSEDVRESVDSWLLLAKHGIKGLESNQPCS